SWLFFIARCFIMLLPSLPIYFCYFLSHVLLPTRATLCPYTTLFRSNNCVVHCFSPFVLNFNTIFHNISWYTFKWYRIWHVVNSRSEEHTSELQSRENLVCRLLLEKKNT